MKYQDINKLDAAIEHIISGTVKHYYSDWKNHDRLKYMCLKGSTERSDKEFILLARTCGTYIIKVADIKAGDDWANTLYNYFHTQETSKYFYVNLNKYECRKINPEQFKKALKTA